jgi:tetratricopeptide (TPR) repeat protein
MRAALRNSVLALALSVVSVASAQEGGSEPTPAQVRVAAEAFDKGREAYKAEEFVEAAEQFERADNNAPSPAAIELAIRSRDKAGELDRAATLASLALERYPDDQNLQRLAGDLAKRARPSFFELTASCDQPCDLTVNGKLVHGAPDTQRILYIAPGTLTVRAGWADSRSESKQIQAEAGSQGELRFVAPSTPPSGTKEQPGIVAPEPAAAGGSEKDGGSQNDRSGWSPTVFFVGAGLTAVLGGVTIWSGIDTVNNPGADRVKEECAARMQREECELYQEGLGKQRRTNVLIGVTAGVGLGTALVGLLATDWSSKPSGTSAAGPSPRRVSVTPYASWDGGGLQAVGRF